MGLTHGAGAPPAAREGARQRTHEMVGTVRDLDRQTPGTVSIAVAGMHDLQIHLPSSELANFRQGDRVTVSLGMQKGTASDAGGEDR